MLTLIRHQETNAVYFTGRPRDWVDEIAVDHNDPATWPAAQAVTGLTAAALSELLAVQAAQVAQLRDLLATPAGLAGWLDRQPAETPVGQAQAIARWPSPETVTARYLCDAGLGLISTSNAWGGGLAITLTRLLPRRLEARGRYPAPFWARALEWQIAEHLGRAGGWPDTITAAAACDCLDRALAWERLVRAAPLRPHGYRRLAERADAYYC